MNFGAELFTLRSLSLQPQDSFELFITIDGKPIPETFGKDDYLLPLSLAEGKRICATGRKCMHRRPGNGEQFFETGPSEPAPIPAIINSQKVLLFIKNTVVEEASLFRESFILRIQLDEKQSRVIPLTAQNVITDWSNHGKFLVDLTAIFQELNS
ncbi:MAG TPA: hypothetical protein GX518_00265 [Firmicutes bacterium]|nr:hypothetical protein [Bacillota bacterium]